MSVVLGVDIGTSSVKVAVSMDGAPSVLTAQVAVPWKTTATGGEIDPEHLVDVVLGAVRQTCGAWPGMRVDAVGIASFAESVVLLDHDGAPVSPLVAWYDTRGDAETAQLASTFGPDSFSSITGLPVSSLCSAVKVRTAAVAGLDLHTVGSVLSVTDWVAFRLGGTLAFDLSLAARTGWLDLSKRAWAPPLVDWTGLPVSSMPDVVESGAARGRVRADVPGAPAALIGALVVPAGMDHLVAAVGALAAGPGDVWDSCGTAEAFVRSTSPLEVSKVLSAVQHGQTVGWHADPRHQVVLGAQRSGFAFQRVLGLLGVATAEDLRRFEDGPPPSPDPSGKLELRDLYDAAYAVVGLTSRTGPHDLWATLLRQVAADGAALLARSDAVAGPHRRVVMGGGWAASTWFREAKRKHHERIGATDVAQPGAEGAAAMARRALAK